MTKKRIIFFICLFVLVLVMTIVLLFLSTFSWIKINYLDENGEIFKTSHQIISIYNKKLKAKEVLGYDFVGWEEDYKDGVVSKFGAKTIYAYYKVETFNMPIIKVATEKEAKIKSKEVYTPSSISVTNTSKDFQLSGVSAGIRLRGNSTSLGDKKPYRIKFDEKVNLLGLNNGASFKSWVLLAEWYDYSLSRNALNFNIAKEFDFYSSDFQFVELFINGEYRGVYLLCEQQQIDENRINVEEYKEGETDEFDTGILLENDYYYYKNEDYVIENKINGEVFDYTHWIVKSDNNKPQQLEYIQNYMQGIYDLLYSTNATQEQISNVIDIDSAVDMTIMQLLQADSDVNSSFYVFKDKGGKLQFGAPWDADMSYGNLENPKVNEVNLNHLLLNLYSRDWFAELIKAKWKTLDYLKDKEVNFLQQLSQDYKKEFERNFKVYKVFGKKNFFAQSNEVKKFKNQGDASAYLQTWIEQRFEFLDTFLV